MGMMDLANKALKKSRKSPCGLSVSTIKSSVSIVPKDRYRHVYFEVMEQAY